MRPTTITSIHFGNIAELREFLTANEPTALAIRDDLVKRLKGGEGLIAVLKDGVPHALVLNSVLQPDTRGTTAGETLVSLPFGNF